MGPNIDDRERNQYTESQLRLLVAADSSRNGPDTGHSDVPKRSVIPTYNLILTLSVTPIYSVIPTCDVIRTCSVFSYLIYEYTF